MLDRVEPKRLKVVIVGVSEGCDETDYAATNKLISTLLPRVDDVLKEPPVGTNEYTDPIHEHLIYINGVKRCLSVQTTAGQDEFDRLRPLTYTNTDVFIILFNRNAVSALENIRSKWYPEIKHYCPNTPILFVNVNSVTSIDPTTGNRLPAPQKTGTAKLDKDLTVNYMTCNLNNEKEIVEVFDAAIRLTINNRPQQAIISNSPETQRFVREAISLAQILRSTPRKLPADVVNMIVSYIAGDIKQGLPIWRFIKDHINQKPERKPLIARGFFATRNLTGPIEQPEQKSAATCSLM